jgi:hypothetical protein
VGWDDATSTKGGFGILCIGSEGIIFITVDDVAIVVVVLLSGIRTGPSSGITLPNPNALTTGLFSAHFMTLTGSETI